MTDRFAGYDIVGRIARGGMAEILLARSPSPETGRHYLVLKRVLPKFERDKEFVQMFLDEARVNMYLQHPNICRVYGYGEHEGSHFIALEWINGVSLRQLIGRAFKDGEIGIPLALYVTIAVADALEFSHHARDEHGELLGLIHRDVSPHNIMLSYDGDVKLLDFGIAKAKRQAHRTNTGVVKGKYAYCAPERFTGGIGDPRVDIFSLGVCLFESLVGRTLFGRSNEAKTIHAVLNDPPRSLEEFFVGDVTEVDEIIAKALAKDPEARYPTAKEFSEAMSKYARATSQTATGSELARFVRQMFVDRLEQR